MALLGVALAASLMGKLSQKHGGKDLADQAFSSAFRFGTRTRTILFNPIARTITYLTGNQWHLGRNLPYLEVPPLLESAKRVQERAKLELSSSEFKKFKLDLEAFLDSSAYTLQAKLHVLSCVDPVSWIDRFWEAMYLYGRDCPIERASWIGYGRRNPSNLDRFTGNDKFLVRAACLLTSAMNYRRELVAGTLRENMVFSFGSANASIPIDAAKCLRTFGTYRVPGVECDRFVDHPNSTHIVVLYKGRTYVLNLMYENRMKRPEELYVNLHAILNDHSGEGGFNVNILTTQKRKDWA